MGSNGNTANNAAGVEAEKGKTVKVKFKKDYMGGLGSYRSGKTYDLPANVYAVLKSDCEEIK